MWGAPRRQVQRGPGCFIVSVVSGRAGGAAKGDSVDMYLSDEIDMLCVNAIRCLSVDAVETAN